MRLCVIVQSEDNLATAGVRIRYQRTAACLEALGHTLDIAVLDDFRLDPENLADAYLLCKCHDARALVLAAELRAEGRHLGADFFDDYYSQSGDSRFVYIREWLRQAAPLLTFAMCSTPLMQEVIATLLPGLPCHMLNDPAEPIDAAALASGIGRKLERVRRTGILDTGWFGIGDNQHFPVGLSDLAEFGGHLSALSATGLSPRLSILTNKRALTADRLDMLKRLPIPWRIEEWSPEAEQQLIAESFACFIPVNAQRFSTLKSLNRALSALTNGAQVLSVGFPLYESLGTFIYRDAAALLADITSGTLRLRPDSLPAFADTLRQHGDPAVEAARLAAFLESLSPAPALPRPALAVIHGRQSHGGMHKFVQRMGHLSIAGPWAATPGLNYDLRIASDEAGEPIAIVSERAVPHLRDGLLAMARPSPEGPKAQKPVELPLSALGIGEAFDGPGPLLALDSVFAAFYGQQISAVEDVALRLFGPRRTIVSELSSPFWRGPAPEASEPAA